MNDRPAPRGGGHPAGGPGAPAPGSPVSGAAEGAPRPRRRRLLRVLVACVLGLGGLYLLRDALVHPWMPGLLSRWLGHRLGAEVHIESVGGDWFRELRLDGVTLRDEPGFGTVRFEELRLLHRRGDVRRVEVRGLRGDLRLAGFGSSTPDAGGGLPSLPELVLTGGPVALRGDGWAARLEDFEAKLAAPGGPRQALGLTGHLGLEAGGGDVQERGARGTRSWSGALRLEGTLGAEDWRVDEVVLGPGPGGSRFALHGAGSGPAGSKPQFERAELTIDDLAACLDPDRPSLDPPTRLSLSATSAAPDHVELAGTLAGPAGEVRLGGAPIATGPAAPLDGLDLELELTDLGALARLLRAAGAPPAAWLEEHGDAVAGTLAGAVRLSGDTSHPRARVELVAQDLHGAGADVGRASVEGDLDLGERGGGTLVARVTGGLRLDLASLDRRGQGVDRLVAELALGPREWTLRGLVADQGPNRLDVPELTWERVPGADGLLAGARGSWSLEVVDLPRLLGRPLHASLEREHRIVLAGELDAGGVRLVEGELSTPGGGASLRGGSLVPGPAPSPDAAGGWVLDAELDVAFADLRDLGPLTGSGTWAGSLEGRTRIFGTWPALEADVDLVGQGLSLADRELGDLEVDARIDADAIEVQALNLSRGADFVRMRGAWLPREAAFAGFEVEARWSAPDLPGLPSSVRLASVAASGALDGPWWRPRGDLDVTLEGEDGSALEAGRLLLRGGEEGLVLDELVLATPDAQLRLAGRLERPAPGTWSVDVETLGLDGPAGELTLTEPGQWTWDGTTLRIPDVLLEGPAGRLRGDLTHGGGQTRVRLAAEDLRVPPGTVPRGPAWLGWTGTLAGEFEFDVDGQGARLGTRGQVEGWPIPGTGEPADLTWDLGLGDGWLTVGALTVQAAGGGRLDLDGRVPWSPGGTETFPAGDLDLRIVGRDWDLGTIPWRGPGDAPGVTPKIASRTATGGRARLDAHLTGTWDAPAGSVALRVDDLSVQGRAAETPGTFEAVLHLGRGIEVETLELVVPGRLYAQAAGTVEVPLEPERWWAEGAAVAEEGTLDLGVTLDAEELSWLAPELAQVRRVSGVASGHGWITGPLRAPELEGEFLLHDAELKLASEVPAMAGVELRLRLAGRSLEIEEMVGELGGAPFQVRGGADWADGGTRLDLEVQGSDLLLRRERGLLLRADSTLTVRGPVERLAIGGEVRLRSSRYTRDVDLLSLGGSGSGPSAGGGSRGLSLFVFLDEPLADATLDIQISADEPLTLRNNVIDGGLWPNLALRGTGDVPRLEGSLRLAPTSVDLPASQLLLQGGSIRFDGTAPLIPRLELTGTARKLGYDITVGISGDYDAPEVRLSSSPPLTDDEILLLLLAGRPPGDSLDRGAARDAGQTVALYLAEDVVSGWLSRGDDEGPGFLDRLRVTTGREVSDSGLPTGEISFLITEDRAGDGRRFLLAMERDRYEDYGIGLRFVLTLR